VKAAASDKHGVIMNVRTLGGHEISAGQKTFGGQYGRESAKWQKVLRELIDHDLVVDHGQKGEVFELTHEGWMLADES
jgi:hypothetical protein